MALYPEIPKVRVRLSYAPIADVLSGQVGEPHEARLVEIGEDLDIYVQTNDAGELTGFELRNFQRSFNEADRVELGLLLGPELLPRLDRLHEQVHRIPEPIRLESREQLSAALTGAVRTEFE